MVEKNITNENRQVRSKFHSLEAENTYLKEKLTKLDDTLKVAIEVIDVPSLTNRIYSKQERDKEIASLSIYRYNAIHKKMESSVCKKCLKREKEESEQRRKQTILGTAFIFSVFWSSLTTTQTISRLWNHQVSK
jgi:hypothetical protein